jgi:hypothetical protein
VTLPSGETILIPMVMLYPGYFPTVGVPLVTGREFNAADIQENAPAVCVFNEAFVRLKFPNEDPIGKPCFTGRRDTTAERNALPPEPYQIVGVVKDSRYGNGPLPRYVRRVDIS